MTVAKDVSKLCSKDVSIDVSDARRLYGISGWDASTALATASGFGVAGSPTTGLAAVVMFYLNAVPAGTQTLCQRQAVTSGWLMRSIGSSLRCSVGNASALAEAPTTTLTAAHVGKVHLLCCTSDAAAVYQYLDGAQVGTSTALAGYAAAASRTVMGSTASGANPATSYTILGVAGRDAHLSAADFAAICAASKAAGSLSFGGVAMDHVWRAPAGGEMPATLEDALSASASDDMTFVVGSAANVAVVPVADAWGF